MHSSNIIITLTLWLTLVDGIDEQPYCAVRYKRLCQGKGRHVACQFPDPGPGASCVNYTAIQFNTDMKNFILYYVNRRRQRIASGNERVRGGLILPKPEIMMLVEWDRELSFLAQRLADQCHFVHDDCRATVRYPYAGQSVGEVRWRRTGESVERGARRAIRRVLDAWWGERRRATPNQLTAPFRLGSRGAVWGHFSQLCVWGLQAMGCGAVHHGISHPRLLLVCDFSHTNMLGQRTLNPGPLAPCPIHTARRPRTQYPLLCAPVRAPTPVEQEEESYEDDEDFDAGLTVEIADAPAPSIHYTRTRETASSTTSFYQTESPVLVFREDLNAKTKGVLIEKLDKELECKLEEKNQVTEDQVILEWRSRRPVFGQWRDQETFEEVIPLKTTYLRENYDLVKYYRPTTTTTDTPENYLRHRWKQTRDRPLRPGANALFPTQPVTYIKRQSVASMMLDKEDVDQLFRDTGFKLKKNYPLAK